MGSHGARFTLLLGYVFLFLAFLSMLLLWKEDISYWQVALAYVFIGIGVGLAGTPASYSLTGSVPVERAGMASGTADLQRDLGGALMTSIFGALLTAGYASAMGAAIAASDKHVTDSTQSQLQLSFSSAENLAEQHPQYESQITAAAKSSFLEGDQWAYTAGAIAILLGAVLVFFLFPKKDEEEQLRAAYHAQDTSRPASPNTNSDGAVAQPASPCSIRGRQAMTEPLHLGRPPQCEPDEYQVARAVTRGATRSPRSVRA